MANNMSGCFFSETRCRINSLMWSKISFRGVTRVHCQLWALSGYFTAYASLTCPAGVAPPPGWSKILPTPLGWRHQDLAITRTLWILVEIAITHRRAGRWYDVSVSVIGCTLWRHILCDTKLNGPRNFTIVSMHNNNDSDNGWFYDRLRTGAIITRSSATAKSTARPSCLVGVLYDIYRETNNRSTSNQPLVRNWPWNLPNSAK